MSKKYNKKKNVGLKLTALFVVILLVAAAWCVLSLDIGTAADSTAAPITKEETVQNTGETVAERKEVLVQGLIIEKIGSYSGAYVEDGTNEPVENILMMVVSNITEEDIQYVEFLMPVDAGTAKFSASTLPAGSTAVLLEQSRMSYSDDEIYEMESIECALLAIHQSPLSLQEDKLKFQILDGSINVTNISDSEINENIVVYYKNVSDSVYYGGITYRIKLEDTLKPGEMMQIMANHFYQPGTEIVFVEFAE